MNISVYISLHKKWGFCEAFLKCGAILLKTRIIFLFYFSYQEGDLLRDPCSCQKLRQPTVFRKNLSLLFFDTQTLRSINKPFVPVRIGLDPPPSCQSINRWHSFLCFCHVKLPIFTEWAVNLVTKSITHKTSSRWILARIGWIIKTMVLFKSFSFTIIVFNEAADYAALNSSTSNFSVYIKSTSCISHLLIGEGGI